MMTERAVATLDGFQAGYVEVAGVPTWHEVRGEGPAVVLCCTGGLGGSRMVSPGPGIN
jgi:hypothetical protein